MMITLAAASGFRLVTTNISRFYTTYPSISDPREQCAFYRAQNKSFRLFFLSFSICLTAIHMAICMVIVLEGFSLAEVLYVFSIHVLMDLVFILSSVYALYFGPDTIKSKDICVQRRTKTRLMICGIIPTLLFGIIPLFITDARSGGLDMTTWLLYCALDMEFAAWSVGGVLYKVGLVAAFSGLHTYFSFVRGLATEMFAIRFSFPVLIAAGSIMAVDKYVRQNFILRRALKFQRNMYQRFFHQIQDPILILSSNALLYQNDAAATKLSTTQQNVRERLKIFVTDRGWTLADHVVSQLEGPLDEGTVTQKEQYRFQGATEERTAQVTLIASSTGHDAAGSSVDSGAKRTISLFIHDITEELRQEKKRTEEQFKNMLLFSLSHELKTPLNIFQRFLSEAKGLALTDASKALHREAKGAWRYLRNKISDILDYAQIFSGEFALHYGNFSPKRFVTYLRKVTSFLLTEKQRKSVALEFHLEESVPDPLFADRDRLEQVLFNFLSNAARFTERGSISLRILRAKEGHITFTVQDTGCGMTKDTVNCLFALSPGCIKADGSHPQQRQLATKLSGLGLTVSNMICAQMGTDITVTSEPGRGSTLSFRVPFVVSAGSPRSSMAGSPRWLLPPASENSIPEEREKDGEEIRQFLTTFSPMEPAGIGKRRGSLLAAKVALVVDDNDFNRYVAERMVRKFGFVTKTAGNGQAAIDSLRQIQNSGRNTAVLVLMDVDMPVMDGIEATIKIRREGRQPRPMIVALTAFSAESERRKCFEAGMDAFIDKPLTKERLYETLYNLGMDA